jgi:hypothetical protein
MSAVVVQVVYDSYQLENFTQRLEREAAVWT